MKHAERLIKHQSAVPWAGYASACALSIVLAGCGGGGGGDVAVAPPAPSVPTVTPPAGKSPVNVASLTAA